MQHPPFQREFSDTSALSDAEIFKLAVAACEQISDDRGVRPRAFSPGKIFLSGEPGKQIGIL